MEVTLSWVRKGEKEREGENETETEMYFRVELKRSERRKKTNSWRRAELKIRQWMMQVSFF